MSQSPPLPDGPPEVHVYCGGLRPADADPESILVLDAPTASSPERITLNLGPLTRKMVADVPSRLADLVEIAAYVYCADQFSRRDTPLMRSLGSAWRRHFAFHVPMRDLDFWCDSEVRAALVEVLSFLSEDAYTFTFHAKPADDPGLAPYLDLGTEAEASYAPPALTRFAPDRVILFSGGLDSFAGAAETLLVESMRAVLVSHQAAPLLQTRQAALVQALRQASPGASVMHVGIDVNKGTREAKEYTQRSRSFLFASLGVLVARLFERNEVLFYENGVVSLNLPIAQHVLGGRATRTTHPRVLAGFSRLFSLVAERPIRVANPYFWNTKADIVERIANAGMAQAIGASFSCARVREAAQLGARHCGVCSQCIDRRFGVLAAGQGANDPAAGYALDLFTGARKPAIDTTMVESFVLAASNWKGMSQATFLSRFGEVHRALPHLPHPPSEAAARIHDLHRRHGAAVTRVMDEALAEHSSLDAMAALSDSCLVSLVRAPLTPLPPLVDAPAETDPAPAVQAEASPHPILSRPIRLAIDTARQRAVFAAGFEIAGRGYELLAVLAQVFQEDQAVNPDPSAYRYVSWKELGLFLDADEEAVRKALTRLQKAIASQFERVAGVILAKDDIIQNQRWKGYRLNPFLVVQPAAVLVDPGQTVADRAA